MERKDACTQRSLSSSKSLQVFAAKQTIALVVGFSRGEDLFRAGEGGQLRRAD